MSEMKKAATSQNAAERMIVVVRNCPAVHESFLMK